MLMVSRRQLSALLRPGYEPEIPICGIMNRGQIRTVGFWLWSVAFVGGFDRGLNGQNDGGLPVVVVHKLPFRTPPS